MEVKKGYVYKNKHEGIIFKDEYFIISDRNFTSFNYHVESINRKAYTYMSLQYLMDHTECTGVDLDTFNSPLCQLLMGIKPVDYNLKRD